MAALHETPIPFITLPNWVKAASQCGFNIEPVFRELGIETDLIHLESATVSQPMMEQAMLACVARAREHHFPFVLGDTFAFDYLPDVQTFLTTSPTLREAARVFDWVRELINPLIRVRLEDRRDAARLVLDRAGSSYREGPQAYFDETLFASVVKFGRLLLQGQGDFRALQFSHPAPSYADAYARHFRLPVTFGCSETALEMDQVLLDARLEGAYPALHQQAEFRVEQKLTALNKATDLASAMEEVCLRKPALVRAGLTSIAEELGLSTRTLQRRLQEQGRRYGDVLGRIQYRWALRRLGEPGASVEQVSEELGFSDRRSFTRAFSRWSGVTPRAYLRREAL